MRDKGQNETFRYEPIFTIETRNHVMIADFVKEGDGEPFFPKTVDCVLKDMSAPYFICFGFYNILVGFYTSGYRPPRNSSLICSSKMPINVLIIHSSFPMRNPFKGFSES